MEFWHIWWVPLVQDWKQCGLAHCDECENWIQTSSHSYTGIPFTERLVLSGDVALFRCAWRSRGWDCEGKAWCRCIGFCHEEFVACYPDWRWRSSSGCGAQDDTDCKALDDTEVVGIETCQRKTTSVDTEGECTPHWSRVEWGRASKTEGPCGEIHFKWCFRSMESSSMVACMFSVSFGWHRGSQQCFWTMVRCMGTRYFVRFAKIPMAERDISANACQQTCRVSRTWQRRPIKRGASTRMREKWKYCPLRTSSTKSSAVLSSSWLGSSFEVVANEVFCRSCGCFPHVCRDGQWWTHWNAAQIPRFTQSLCIRNNTQSGRDLYISHCSTQCGNKSGFLCTEWGAAGICTSCPVTAQQSTT